MMKTIIFLHGFFASGSCVPATALKEAFEGKPMPNRETSELARLSKYNKKIMSEESNLFELPRCELAEWPVASNSESEGCKAQGGRPNGQCAYS